MRESGVPQFTVDATARSATSTCWASRSRPSSATPTCSPPSTSRASRCTRPTAPRTTRSSIAGGHAAFNPEPVADFVDAAIDRRRRGGRADDHRHHHRTGRPTGMPGGRHELLLRLARTGGVYVPALYDVSYLPDGRIQRVAPRAGLPGRPVAGVQAHRHGPRRVALPQAAARAARRVGARADVGRDLPGLHPGLPVLPGGHDHPPGARALHHRHRRDGRTWPGRNGIRGGRPAVAVVGRPLRDRRHRQGSGRPLRGHADRAVAAVDAGRRLQHRPRQRADPQRAALRADLRARGRQRADPQGHQQDGVRGGPHQDRRRRLRRGLAAGEALLHVRAAHRDRRGRAPDRRPRQEGHRDRAPGVAVGATSGAPCRSAGSCPSRTRRSSGVAQLGAEETDARLAKLREAIRVRPPVRARRSASATTTASPASSRDCCPAATAGSAGSSSRSGATVAGSTAGASTSRSTGG